MDTNNYEETEKMADNGFSASDAVLTSAMSGGFNRGFGGQWGGGMSGDVWASQGSNAVRVNRNGEIIKLGIDRISDQNEETRRNLGEARVMDNITIGHNRLCDHIMNNDRRNSDQVFQQELRTNDRLLALQAEINANARVADKCCCDIQLNQCKDTAAIMARMEALSKEGIERDLDRAERELVALKTQVACGCTTGCSNPCN